MIKRTIIRPPKGLINLDLRELWGYRELFYIFAWRDIKVRYKQTFLGVIWVLLQPVVSTFIFTIFFGRFAQPVLGNIPYPLFALSGLVFWNFFSNTLSHASSSFVENENIVKKVYFPRLILPLSSAVSSFVDFSINLMLLLIVAAYLGYFPSWNALLLIPFGVIVSTIASCGLGLFLSSLNVKYRDVRYVLPFFIQLMIFLTPVIYPLASTEGVYKWILILNPMTGVIESVRSTFFGRPIALEVLAFSCISAIAILVMGLFYFRKTEKFLADII